MEIGHDPRKSPGGGQWRLPPEGGLYWSEPERGAWRGVVVLEHGAHSEAPVCVFRVQKKDGQSEASLHFRLAKEFFYSSPLVTI